MKVTSTTLIGVIAMTVALSLSVPAFGDGEKACCADKAVVAQSAVEAKAGCDGSCSSDAKNGHQGGNRAVMQGAHTLVFNKGDLTRTVTEIPGGVRTVNTTTNPKLVATLQSHPREMSNHLSNGGHVRKWDPVFTEIAKYQDKITMTYKNLENGIEVTSVSNDENATALIRAHAYKVSEFVARGKDAMHESTPLPEGYVIDSGSESHESHTTKGKSAEKCH